MLRINDLSDDCLRLIFSRLSLSCKLTLHRICPRWRSLQYSVTCQSTSLRLLLGTGIDSRALLARSCLKVPYLDQIEPHSSPFSEHSTLEMTKLSRNVTCQLMQLLPSVTSLELCLNDCGCSAMNDLLDLLRFYSSNLKYLSLYYDILSTHCIRGFSRWLSHFELINEHCLALDYLSIEFQGSLSQLLDNYRKMYPNEAIPAHLDLSCLARLREFRFYSFDHLTVLSESFKSYANESSRLEKIAIANVLPLVVTGNNVDDLFKATPQLMSKFTLLRCIISPSEYYKFTSLTSLSMSMNWHTWTQFTTYLSPLKSLIHVKLDLSKDVLSEYDSTASFELAQLPSIRIIQVELLATTFTELLSQHWGWIFPSLQLLELKLYTQGETANREVRAASLNLLLEPFKLQCDKLRRIVTIDLNFSDKKVWELVEGDNWKEALTV